jgi:HEPN domain-containing protein
MRTNEGNPADWYRLADDRLAAADSSRGSAPESLSAIELLQEAAERYLKGYLISKNWKLEKTRDLAELIDAASARDPRFSAFYDMADELTHDFFSQHYPGGDLADIGDNYDEWRAAIDEIRKIIGC